GASVGTDRFRSGLGELMGGGDLPVASCGVPVVAYWRRYGHVFSTCSGLHSAKIGGATAMIPLSYCCVAISSTLLALSRQYTNYVPIRRSLRCAVVVEWTESFVLSDPARANVPSLMQAWCRIGKGSLLLAVAL